jgi:hypothetical protein
MDDDRQVHLPCEVKLPAEIVVLLPVRHGIPVVIKANLADGDGPVRSQPLDQTRPGGLLHLIQVVGMIAEHREDSLVVPGNLPGGFPRRGMRPDGQDGFQPGLQRP